MRYSVETATSLSMGVCCHHESVFGTLVPVQSASRLDVRARFRPLAAVSPPLTFNCVPGGVSVSGVWGGGEDKFRLIKPVDRAVSTLNVFIP